MKILLVNKFYYPRGGDCIYTLGLEKILKSEGHEVAIFAMDCKDNLQSKWESYFPSEVSFKTKNPKNILRTLFRPLLSFEVRKKFNKIINDFQPDVVHLNNVHTQLSPILAKIAKRRGMKVVWTLHDYKLICPRYDCVRNEKPCELCFYGNKIYSLKYKCMKNNRLASFIAFIEGAFWNKKYLQKYTDIFICPSMFMKEKMLSGGFDDGKLIPLNNFINTEKISQESIDKCDYYCYVGRLSQEKGVRTLLKVAAELPFKLKVLGTGPIQEELISTFGKYPNIEFLGHCSWPEVKMTVSSSKFMVVPSEWYENNPLSVIESLCLGTAIVGADIGGIPELIDEGRSGMLFPSGNAEILKETIFKAWNTQFDIQTNIAERFSDQRYVKDLIDIYES